MNMREELIKALENDHPCDNIACDIAAAMKNGFPYVAANLLESATDEVPALRAWHDSGGDIPMNLMNCPDWNEWLEFHRKYGVPCPTCNSVNFGDESFLPDSCGNCLQKFEGSMF